MATQGPFSIAYEAMKLQLQQQCPDLQFVSLWNNQVQEMARSKTWQLPFPAAFIEFVKPMRVETLGNGNRIWEPLYVKVHLVSTFYNATNGVDFMEENPGAFDLMEEVYLALVDFWPPGCFSMFSVGEEYDYSHGDVYHTVQTFQTNLVDFSNNRPRGGIVWTETSPPHELDLILNPWEETILVQDDSGPLLTVDENGQYGYLLVQIAP